MSSFKIIVILLFGLLELNSAHNYYSRNKSGRSNRQHNEQCVPYDSSASCNNTQGLMCIDTGLKGYRCLCPSNTLHAQVYDPKRETCVGKVLNTCVRSSDYKDLNDSLCVENAECDTAMYGMAICMCKPGFTENDEGSCVPSFGYLEVCGNGQESTSSIPTTTKAENGRENTSTSTRTSMEADDDEANEADTNRKKRKLDESERKCDEKRGLSCINSKCQCKFGSEQFYNETEKKCVSYGGGRCADGSNVYSCVANAKCPVTSTMSRPSRLPPPPPYLTEIDNKEDKQDEEGKESVLVIPFPFKPPRFPFPPSLHHRLPPPFHFNHASASASASGGHASASTHNQPQFNPLEDIETMKFEVDFGRSGRSILFKKNKTDYYPRCECLPGFSLTSDGNCMKSYASKCDPNDDKQCNSDQYMECMESQDLPGGFTCQCRNPLNERFDSEKNTCVAIMGKRCKVGENYPKCEKGECLNGRCACTNGSSLTPMDTCKKNFGESCQPGECNTFNFLICHGKGKSEKKCQCLDSYMTTSNGRCLASDGDECGHLKRVMGKRSFIGVRPEVYIECEEGYKCDNQTNKGQQSAVSRCVKI